MVTLNASKLELEALRRVAREREPVQLGPQARRRLADAAAMIDRLVAREEKVYGVTTGVGHLRTFFIPGETSRQLQKNILRSHAAGVGPHLSEEIVRAMMLLRVHSFCWGHSGVRPEIADALVRLLNEGVHPAVPAQGSLGASGDLAPLAHIALVLLGEGETYVDGRLVPAAHGLAKAGLQPRELAPKEGLALINGTQMMAGIGVLALLDSEDLVAWADAAAALTLEALRANASAFDVRIQRLRPYVGHLESAARIRALTRGSARLRPSDPAAVQDAYSLRCVPQVHGAVRDALSHVRGLLEVEVNSVTDNPLLFPEEGDVLNGGNFHGEPLALGLDYLAMAVSELASISERRIDRLVNPYLSGMPPFLALQPGLHSGYMVAHYTAAALASENKSLAHPASVDSIPTSGGQEDHVSMGSISARKARAVVENTRRVIAAELLCAAQAVDLSGGKGGEGLGRGTKFVYERVRERVLFLETDRVVACDLNEAYALLQEREVLAELHTICRGS